MDSTRPVSVSMITSDSLTTPRRIPWSMSMISFPASSLYRIGPPPPVMGMRPTLPLEPAADGEGEPFGPAPEGVVPAPVPPAHREGGEPPLGQIGARLHEEGAVRPPLDPPLPDNPPPRSEEHTSELQSRENLVCR